MGIQCSYRRPKHTHAVKGVKWCGRTGEGESYVTEAVYGETVGYGSGDSPEAARKAAYADLIRTLDAPPPVEEWRAEQRRRGL